ncbi:hypothetical protein [[Clostridium] fimetarium]|uniref:Uncharacterized protein n=1 Tax=[Clostridium] fimetarium TaxID=99656 RepID=A0A1I0R625_9FIRM|nr:hypothetical protein [[Clostridium] fimetarium]SEW36051.1 hypothetical protein SAMN05421659_11249 [[Clostridium] fimetarium]
MKKLPIVEVVMGAVLLISIIGFYALQQNGGSNAQKLTIENPENNSESSGQLLDTMGQPYTSAVFNDKSGSNSTIADKMDYYSKKVYITEDKFLNQQYGNIGDTVYCAKQMATSLNYTPVSAKVTNIEITKKIDNEYMQLIETRVKHEGDYGTKEWNCFIRNHANMSAAVTKEMAESICSYVIVDVVLNNYTGNEIIVDRTELKMAVVEDNGLISWSTYSEAANSDYVSLAATGNNGILLGKDKAVDYVGEITNGTNGFSNYHEPDVNLVKRSDKFYIPTGELKLKLLYIITDKELATGKVCFCGWDGNEGVSNSDGRKYLNTGIRIRINQGASNEGNN